MSPPTVREARTHDHGLRGSRSGSVVAAWVVCVGLVAMPAASAADSVYWSNASGNKISFANLDGTGGGDLFTGRRDAKGRMMGAG